MSAQEQWHWVHFSYGEELGLTSEDDDYQIQGSTDPEQSAKLSDQIGSDVSTIAEKEEGN